MRNLRSAALVCLLTCSGWVAAEYSPDVLELDGSRALEFPAVDELYLATGGTIEFWVSPDWTVSPAYDPAVVSNAGVEGASYLVAVLRDRDGLGIVSGDAQLMVGFDFTDNQLHHVALSYFEGQLAVYIDGQLRSSQPFEMVNLPASGFWIGTADGSSAPFVGAIAALRVWGTPVAQEDIVKYAARDVRDGTSGHPDTEALRAISDFNEADLLLPADQ